MRGKIKIESACLIKLKPGGRENFSKSCKKIFRKIVTLRNTLLSAFKVCDLSYNLKIK